MKEYFTNNFSKEIWETKYKHHTDETIEDTWLRVAKDLSSVEKDKEKWTKEFYSILEDFCFAPGGRITANAGTGRKGLSYINCVTDAFEGEDQDSIESIYSTLLRQAKILQSESGYGFNCDVMRPCGATIKGIGNQSPGAVKFLELWDKSSEIITAGSGKAKKDGEKSSIRKGAQLVSMSIWHPDIIEFIKAKTEHGRLTKFNMSVLCTDEFMQAVETDKEWNLRFPDYESTPDTYKKCWDGNLKKWETAGCDIKIYQTIPAKELWELIMKQTYERNDPGILQYDTINRMNNLWWIENINTTNPCLTGDTLVYVADGRNNITIQQLAEEGKDIPVFCLNHRGTIKIRYMRHPRITGHNQAIYKITLDDGSFIRCTIDHKLLTKENKFKSVRDLVTGDSLHIITKLQGSWKELVFSDSNSCSTDYYFIDYGRKTLKAEHRLIAKFDQLDDRSIPKRNVIHHIDENGTNNCPSNLQILSSSIHDKHHGELMKGDNNPMRRAHKEWDDKKWEMFRKNMSKATSQEKNGRSYNVSNEDLLKHAINLTKKIGSRFSNGDWKKYAKENGLPQQFSKWRESHFNGIQGLAKQAATSLGLENVDADPKSQKMYFKLIQEGYHCEFIDSKLYIIKKCELCNKQLIVQPSRREKSLCSKKCFGKLMTNMNNAKPQSYYDYITKKRNINFQKEKEERRVIQIKIYQDLLVKLGREVLRKEWEQECKNNNIPFRLGKHSPFRGFTQLKEMAKNYNHKIINIELDGYEDVYNGTVDEFHNFLIGGFQHINELNNKPKWHYLCSRQCGEQPLDRSVCLLGNLNLIHYIDTETKDWQYNKLKKDIEVSVRLMDNVNDVSNMPLEVHQKSLKEKRRIGLGVVGYASALMMCRIKYGGKKALELTEKLMEFKTNCEYQASAKLAKEKGPFILFDKEKYLQSKFVQQLNQETKDLISKYGIRNSHLSSIQPTGHTSVFANNISSGLEPIFAQGYIRTVIIHHFPESLIKPINVNWDKKELNDGKDTVWKWTKEGHENILITELNDITYKFDRNRGLTKEEWVEDFSIKYLKEQGIWNENARWSATAQDLSVEDHINTMKIFAKWVDAGASKTLNFPNDYPYEDFKKVYFDAWKAGIKGFTTYRAGTMTNVLSVESSNKNAERPKNLVADIHHTTVHGRPYIVLVGLVDNKPYEIFANASLNGDVDHKVKRGEIIKVRKNRYKAIIGEDEICPINALNDENEDALVRMISTNLQSNCDLNVLVKRLKKTQGSMVSLTKAISRSLEKYIPDGEIEDKCPECGKSNLRYESGCIICANCSHSACN